LRTKRLRITNYQLLTDNPGIHEAATVICSGGLVAFPTETVYGLGANALDPRAVARIYEAKQRALNDPLIVHVADMEGVRRVADERRLTQQQRGHLDQLARAFWPGPLTLVLPRNARVPPNVSAGLDTVAVRMPDHPVAQALIRISGVPIAAPSANRFGHVSPTTAQHVLDDLDGRIDLVLDGGPTRIGVESTVLDLSNDSPRILRPGGVTREALAEVLGIGDWRIEIGTQSPISNLQSLPSPGLLEKHYAPNAQLILCHDMDELLNRQSAIENRKLRVGALLRESQREACSHIHPQFVLGDTMSDIARNLYAGLRALDSAGVDVILMTDVSREGLGEAIADRLQRAAAK
jgi:L-threonylcarbamoyladenylate synthase